MAVTASIKRALEIYGTMEGEVGIFPRDVTSASFRKYMGLSDFHIYGDGNSYCAFPACELIGGKIVGVFSAGPGHASSDRQIMLVIDPATWSIATTIFVLNSAPTSFDTSLIAPLLANGDVVTIKVYTFSKTGGVTSVSSLPTQVEGGVTYSFWSRVKKRGSVYYRTAYGGGSSALFTSPDGKAPWTLQNVLFAGGAQTFTETDFDWRADGTMLAVAREETGGATVGNLYYTTASATGSSPAAATAFVNTKINGVQPNLIALASGDMLLMTGDRTGASGMSAGQTLCGVDTTGIDAWRLPTGLAPTDDNWTLRQALGQFYSTDGGQPYIVALPSGNVIFLYYARRSVGRDPQIFGCIFDPSKL